MSSVFIETSDTDGITALLSHLGLEAGSDNKAALVGKVAPKITVLFTDKQSEKEAEESLYLVVFLLQQALKETSDAAQQTKLIEQVIAALTNAPEPFPVVRLKILSAVFNLPNIPAKHPARPVIFCALVSYAANANQSELIIPLLDKVEGWLAEWGTSAEGRRSVLLAVTQALAKSRGRSALAHGFLLKFLGEFQGAADAAKAEPQAVEAVVQAITTTDIYQFERYLDLTAVQALSKGSNKALFELLSIFASRSIADFLAFEKANGQVLKSLGVDRDAGEHKMRLLSLCTLASTNEQISFADAAACMQVSETDVERWVIRAISAKLIDARIDQPNRRVVVNSSTERMFSSGQWAALQAKLSQWRDGVANLVTVVRKVREDNAEPKE